jgi:hypothetical protein
MKRTRENEPLFYLWIGAVVWIAAVVGVQFV